MKCYKCNKKAVVLIRRKKYACKEHFNQWVRGRVESVIRKFKVKGKIAVAISGGKDSATCLKLLSTFKNLQIFPFHINLGIKSYSKSCLKAVRKVCSELKLEPHIIDLKKEYGITLDRIKGRKCSDCGTIKRYLSNKFAFENRLDWVATGHNLTDELVFILNNLLSGQVSQLLRIGPALPSMKEKKLVGRIKPLYFLMESETEKFAILNEIPFYRGKCPYSKEAPTTSLKKIVKVLEKDYPDKVRNLVNSFLRIKEKLPEERFKTKFCKKCGYPSLGKICKFCRIVQASG